MKDQDIRKKLSLLKTAPAPTGYWSQYWPRLRHRIASQTAFREVETSSFRWSLWVPLAAGAFAGMVGYFLGAHHPNAPAMMRDSALMLTSDTGETKAQQVFQQMLSLFPDRVSWISFQDGKVDFSVSSVAYREQRALIPIAIVLPRPKNPVEARFLIRAGQSARAEGWWDKKTPVFIQVQVSPDGKKALVTCHMKPSSLETEVDITREGQQPLGTFRMGERLVQAQLARPSQNRSGHESL